MKCFTSALQNEQPGNEARNGMGGGEARNENDFE